MRVFLFLIYVTVLSGPVASAQTIASDVVGTWEGESVCVVENPCHTEHVIYDIIAANNKNTVTIRADKVVNGKRLFMGALDCVYDAAQHRLSCPWEGAKPGDWEFNVAGDTMTGTLRMREGNQLFRNIRVKRAAAK